METLTYVDAHKGDIGLMWILAHYVTKERLMIVHMTLFSRFTRVMLGAWEGAW